MADQPRGTVALLVTDDFEEVELTSPRQALDAAGATTHLVSPKGGKVKAWAEDDWGPSYDVDRTLDEADPDDYDVLVLPGGVLNPDSLRTNEQALAFARAFMAAGKPVAAICHGPWTLAEVGAVDGRRLTSYPSIRTDLVNAGATWVDEAVVEDGPFVTSRSPKDLPAFNAAVVRRLERAPAAA